MKILIYRSRWETWIEPFLKGSSPIPPEVVVEEAIEKGTIANREQLSVDRRAALATLTNPMRRNRLLRLIADLSLVDLAPDIESLLTAQPAEVRAGAIRALSRLNVERGPKDLIRPLLHDPVQDVRKAAQTALRIQTKEPHPNMATRVKSTDGTRSWTVGDPNETDAPVENDWKARLRSMMDE